MKLVSAYIFWGLLLGLHQKGTDAVSKIDVSGMGNVIDGALQVCPNTTVNLICSHDSPADLTRWRVTPRIPNDCNTAITHTNTESMCGPFTISMISPRSDQTRMSTLELAVNESLNGSVVTCFAGASEFDSQAGNFTILIISPPSTPTDDSVEYSVVDELTGRVTILASSSGTFGTEVSFYGSVEGSGSVEVTDNNIIVNGLSYTESHTVSMVATSAVCPGVLNSSITDVPVVFNIKTLTLTQLNGFVDCSNSSLPINGLWSFIDGVQDSNDPVVQLTPPRNDTPSITYTSAGGLSGSAVFVPDSSYQLTDTVENDVYTFTVTVTNAAGSSSEVSAVIEDRALVIDNSTLETMNCLTFSLGQNCASMDNGDFSIQFEQGSGVCRDLLPSDFSTSNIQLTSQSTCVLVTSSMLCYRANLVYDGTIVDTQSNLNFNACPVSALLSLLGSGVSYQLDGEASSNVSHLTTATLSCSSVIYEVSESFEITCIDGSWEPAGLRSCVFAVWLIVVIILIILVLACAIGVVCGLLTARCLPSLVNGLVEKKWWAILADILLIFVFGFGVGVLFYMCCCKRDSDSKSKPRDSEKLTRSTSSPPPPPDSLYADPNSIEHQAAPGTEDQYAMVDRKGKKNTKQEPTSPEALYQDPNTIEHETAASGDTYAVVDKPKRSSKKKGGPDVVPPASELTYADIDLSSKRPKPGSGRQAPQQPGEYPKEHPVEYSSVDHGNTSQL